MGAREPIVDLSQIDLSRVIADVEQIRRYNPQRYEMEQLTAVVLEDFERKVCVGYKDVTDREFWVRGHMPGMPLMPGVVMLECAAQLCGYFTQKYDLLGVPLVGFGGLDEVRFRDVVVPGDRLVIACQLIKLRRHRIIVSRFEGHVGQRLVVEGELKGVPIPVDVVQAAGRERP